MDITANAKEVRGGGGLPRLDNKVVSRQSYSSTAIVLRDSCYRERNFGVLELENTITVRTVTHSLCLHCLTEGVAVNCLAFVIFA